MGRDFKSAALPKDFAYLLGLLSLQEQHALKGFALFESFENGVDSKEKSSLGRSSKHENEVLIDVNSSALRGPQNYDLMTTNPPAPDRFSSC